MSAVVVLLRGVNVGSHHRLPMPELVDACEAAGLGRPTTYLQSGNLTFPVRYVPDAAGLRELARLVSHVIHQRFGFSVPAVAVPTNRLVTAAQQAVRGLAEPSPSLLHLVFWERPTTEEGLARLQQGRNELLAAAAAGRFGRDRLQIMQDCAVFDFAESSRDSKLTLPVLERALGVAATARNLRTVRRLAEG